MPKAYGTPTPSQLEKINALAKRPLKAEDVFVFPDKAIGDGLIPTRQFRVHKSLMDVFKVDAIKGVGLMMDHPWASGFFSSRPKPAYNYGRTFDARLKKTLDTSETDETWALFIDHYIVRGREKDGIQTDQLIADIEDGVIFDTSIGFGNDTYECSICNKDYFMCDHLRGREYDGEICTVILKPPGFLMENSLVFDGAYPGAGILSGMSPAEVENIFDPVEDLKGLAEGTKLLHTFSGSRGQLNTFKLREPVKGIIVPDITQTNLSATAGGVDISAQSTTQSTAGDEVPGKEEVSQVNLRDEVFAAVLQKAGIDPENLEGVTVEQVMDALASVWQTEFSEQVELQAVAATSTLMFALPEADVRRALGLAEADASIPENWDSEVVRLSREGRDARVELVNDTLEWGVRAEGNDFAIESYREMLSESGRSLQAIKDIREQFMKKAKEALNSGRVTEIQAQGKTEPRRIIPADAYKC